jgi:membrane protein DedA with SNARE-associated domain
VSHLITSLTDFIQNLYVATGLIGIVLAMAIESCCIPLPSEIVMPLAGAMVALADKSGAKHLLFINPASPLWLNLTLIALSGAVGCLIGSIAAYSIGYTGGRPLMLKYGKYVLISQHDADKADRFFQRWGSPTAFFSRLLPVVRTYISLPAGISKMPFGKFCIYTFLGSLPWCLLLAYLGYQLGTNYDKISGPLHYLDIAILVAVVILVVLYIRRHIRNDRKARAEHAAAEANDVQQMPGNNPPWGQPPFQAAANNAQQMPGNNLPWGQPPFQAAANSAQQMPGNNPPWGQPPFQAQQPMNQPFAPPPLQGPPPAQQLWGAPPAQQPQWGSPPGQPSWGSAPVQQPQWGQPSVPPGQPSQGNPSANGWR